MYWLVLLTTIWDVFHVILKQYCKGQHWNVFSLIVNHVYLKVIAFLKVLGFVDQDFSEMQIGYINHAWRAFLSYFHLEVIDCPPPSLSACEFKVENHCLVPVHQSCVLHQVSQSLSEGWVWDFYCLIYCLNLYMCLCYQSTWGQGQ